MASARRPTRNHLGIVKAALERYRLLGDNRRLRALNRLNVQSSLILDAAPEGIVGLDLDGRIIFANPAAASMLDHTVEELHGQPFRTHMQLSGSSATVDLGDDFPIECANAPLSRAGHSVGTVVIFRDISQRRSVEEMKDELISHVSHELRTPLTSIRSALGLLGAGVVGPMPVKAERMLDIAVKNTDRLIRLINDTLDLERVDSAQFRMQRVLCDAAELMTDAADGVRSLADQARVVLDIVPIQAHVWGDPDRLLQVLTNMLSNAIKFSPSAGGTVWIEAEASSGELLIRVRDEGRGIPADKLEFIFDRFGQVQLSDSREKGGSGLGLAICRSIVKQHGGRIWAESTSGAGTTVCVALPCDEKSAGECTRRLASACRH
ncbi:MAG: ATP-binding protein [Chloroflexota bacterium]|nr:ATP-binding protein [Chloroflexota bacterium]